MTYFFRFRFAVGLAFFGLAFSGVAGAMFGAGSALAQTQAEQISILSGFETSASERTRTIIRTRRRGDRLVVDKWRVPLGGDSELDGGQNGNSGQTSGRAATGKSAEARRHGVRVINVRGASRHVVRPR